MINDSGARREFETGAVRDIQEGKGRCDLLPLDILTEYFPDAASKAIFEDIDYFKCYGDEDYLSLCLSKFSSYYGRLDETSNIYKWTNMLLEVSKHFEEGAKKYGEYNWQKGIPTHCYIDSAVRHFLKFIRGDKDEPHDRAFVWNILCCMWTCKNKPELNDYPRKENEEKKTCATCAYRTDRTKDHLCVKCYTKDGSGESYRHWTEIVTGRQWAKRKEIEEPEKEEAKVERCCETCMYPGFFSSDPTCAICAATSGLDNVYPKWIPKDEIKEGNT